MDKNVIGTIVVTLLVLVALWGMYRSWLRRSRRDAGLASASARGVMAVAHDEDDSSFSVLYVATTPTDAPLQRLNLPGLGFRAKAKVGVFGDVIEIAPAGEQPSRIGAASFIGVRNARVAIDRVVEKSGLTAIDWLATNATTGERTLVTSYFRIPNIRLHEKLEASLEAFGAAHTATVKEVAS